MYVHIAAGRIGVGVERPERDVETGRGDANDGCDESSCTEEAIRMYTHRTRRLGTLFKGNTCPLDARKYVLV